MVVCLRTADRDVPHDKQGSVEGCPSDTLDSEKSTTMERKQKDWFGPHRFYLGIDVGRPFLRAVGLEPGGTIAISYRQDRCQEDVEALLNEAESGTLVNCGPEEQHRLAYRVQVVREKDRCRIPSREGDEVRLGDVRNREE